MNDEVISLRKRLDSQTSGMERLLRENADLQARVNLMEAEKRQWQAEKATQNAIIAQRITEMNAQKDEQAKEIIELRTKLMKLEDMVAGDL